MTASARPGSGPGIERDAIWLMAVAAVQNLLALLVQILLARNLAVPEFGRLIFFNGFFSILFLVGTAGVSAFLPAIARVRALEGKGPPLVMLAWGAGAAAVVGSLNVLAYAAGVYAGFKVQLSGNFLLVSGLLIPACVNASIQGILIGYGRTRLFFFVTLGLDSARFLGTLALVMGGHVSLSRVIAVWVCVEILFMLVNLGIFLPWARRFPDAFAEKIRWTQHNLDALAYLVPSAAAVIIPRMLIFMTGVSHSAEDTARLGVALVFMSAFAVLLMPYQTALLSNFQVYRAKGRLRPRMLKSAGHLAALMVGCGVAILLAGRFLLVPLFGEAMAPARGYFPMLLLVFALDAPKALLDVFCVGMLPRWTLISTELLKAVGVAAVFLLIPKMGILHCLGGMAVVIALANGYKAFKAVTFAEPGPA